MGEEVPYKGRHVIGLNLEHRRKLVKARMPVILAVGADSRRIPALYTALKYRLCNIWVGDEATARVLLGEWVFTSKEIENWTAERPILDDLGVYYPQ